MRNNLRLYHKVLRPICQWLPEEPVTRKRNLALLMVGLYLSGSVFLSHIVREWPVAGKQESLINRLRRFLKNEAVSASSYIEPLVAGLLQAASGNGLNLIIDATQVGSSHRALVVALAYRGRSLPLAWSIHEGNIGNVKVTAVVRLLERVYRLIPFGTEVSLTGDSAFRSSDILLWLDEHEWHYVIRQRKEVYIRYPDTDKWFPISEIPLQEGETKVVGWVWLAKSNPFGLTWLLLHWSPGEDVPWLLVSDWDCSRTVLRRYRRRAWIEAMYRDMKSKGFDLEATQLRHAERIERLMLGVCLVYLWLIALGSWVVKNGYRHLIGRKSRRDKGYFRIGLDWLKRRLRLGRSIRFRVVPYYL